MVSRWESNRLRRSVQWKRSVLSSRMGQVNINSFSLVIKLALVSWFNNSAIQFVTFLFGGSVFLAGCRVILVMGTGRDGMGNRINERSESNCKGYPW